MQLVTLKSNLKTQTAIATQFVATEIEQCELWLNNKLDQDITLQQRLVNGWMATAPLRRLLAAIALTIIGFAILAWDWLLELSVQKERTVPVRLIRRVRLFQLRTARKIERWHQQGQLLIEISRVRAQSALSRCRNARDRARLILGNK
ncbi:MAG: hypothetical protein KME13_23430 [Myxacorys californica WJT36-NPBG1]|jgi:hypothetical protein|nr:hypothetical protein [Myxacorys californica WJT36-NPBG1]